MTMTTSNEVSNRSVNLALWTRLGEVMTPEKESVKAVKACSKAGCVNNSCQLTGVLSHYGSPQCGGLVLP